MSEKSVNNPRSSVARFHWMLPKGAPAPCPDVPGWTHFCKQAEEAGIESLLVSFSKYEPDPILVSAALGQTTSKLKFIAAYRSGLMKPTSFVQQINTVSAFMPGRLALNIVAGSSTEEQHGYGDFLAHDEQYARAEEFLDVCHSYWNGNDDVDFNGKYYQVEKGKLHTPLFAEGNTPEIYISGHSQQAEQLAVSKGTCLLRVADTVENLKPVVARVRERGIEVCLRMCVICRSSRTEAIEVAESLLPRDDMGQYERSVWMTLVGSYDDVAGALLEYKQIGVTQFIMSGWPEFEEVRKFGGEVIPRVRRAEARL